MKIIRNFVLMALIWLAMSPAWAAMVATPRFSAEPERALILTSNTPRQLVVRQLVEHGVDRAEALQRVEQMNDREIVSLRGSIDQLPAGAGVSTTNLLLIVIILLLVL